MRTIAALLATAWATTAVAADAPLARIVIKPGPMSEATGGIVEITEVFPAMDVAAGASLLSLDNQAPGMTGPQRLEGLSVSDAAGPVPLTPDKPDAPTAWTTTRAVRGEMTVRYRLPVTNDDRAAGGPPINLRVDGDGVSAVGGFLLAQPATKAAYRVNLEWDLSAMGKGAAAVSTFGDGDVALPAGPLSRLDNAFYMAGTLKRQPDPPNGAFQAVWSGDAGFDPRPSLVWAQQLHGWMSRFFRDPAEPPYRIFLRYNPAPNAGGGAAYPHSFLWTYGQGVAPEHMRAILGHEMTHTWTAAAIGKWYSEGDAVYYQQRLPWMAGMVPAEAYLADINKTAARYYTNDLVRLSDPDAMADYWSDVRKIVIPYDRGAMYFAALNGKIRKASNGARSVDDLIRVVVDRNRRGEATSEADWIALVRAELGDDGLALHQAMMAGEVMVPDSGAYGSCFRRVPAKVRRYELGYRQDVAVREGVVRGLIAGSEADKAGIREGDRIVLRTNTDGAQRDPAMTLTVQVARDGKTTRITYLPRGAAVDAFQWERDPAVAEAACRP